jgi:hypothetical protein
MTFFRLCILAAATTLSSCSLITTTAPAPPDFKLSAEALSQKYPVMRKTGAVSLYAQKIETTRDEWGRESHLATGGSLLVKATHPPIMAQASVISITPEYSEARGKATVKRNDRLYIGQDDATTIRIDGTEITLNGPVIIREVAAEDAPPKTPETEKPQAEAPKKEAPKAPQPAAPPEPAKKKPKTAAKPKAESTQPAKTTPQPAAKLSNSPPTAKPNHPTPAAKPKEAAPVDRNRLLKLMREPTDR